MRLGSSHRTPSMSYWILIGKPECRKTSSMRTLPADPRPTSENPRKQLITTMDRSHRYEHAHPGTYHHCLQLVRRPRDSLQLSPILNRDCERLRREPEFEELDIAARKTSEAISLRKYLRRGCAQWLCVPVVIRQHCLIGERAVWVGPAPTATLAAHDALTLIACNRNGVLAAVTAVVQGVRHPITLERRLSIAPTPWGSWCLPRQMVLAVRGQSATVRPVRRQPSGCSPVGVSWSNPGGAANGRVQGPRLAVAGRRQNRDVQHIEHIVLDVPLHHRNDLLASATFAPPNPHRSLTSPDLEPARDALRSILRHHEPYPGMVLDAASAPLTTTAPALDSTPDCNNRRTVCRRGSDASPTCAGRHEAHKVNSVRVAYEEPVTRADIRAIRGVDSDAVVDTLMARTLIPTIHASPRVNGLVSLVSAADFLRRPGLGLLNALPPSPKPWHASAGATGSSRSFPRRCREGYSAATGAITVAVEDLELEPRPAPDGGGVRSACWR